MSAETLREAAALMRSRAVEAPVPPGPWESEFSDVVRTDVPFGNPGYLVVECATLAEAQHIASWHPDVALPVADWLESVAGAMSPPPPESALDVVDAGRSIHPRDEQHALAVARAYLGRDA